MTTTEDQPHALYVGFGIGAYDDTRFEALPRAVPDVEAIAKILRPYGYADHVIRNPDEAALPNGLKAHLAPNALPQGGPLVVMWAGHGEMVAEQTLHLIARDTSKGAAPVYTANLIASYAGRTGASQILLVFDTCHAQAGALPALTIASQVLAARPPDAPRIWVGVVTSALTLEKARDGRFGAHLVRLLRDGPRDEELRLRWSAHSKGVRGDDIIDALLKEWDVHGQSPNGYTAGNAWVMLPNPRYDPDAPERVVEHLLLAAQGRAPDEEGIYFTGRVAQLDQIVGWMRQDGPGVMVVTGPAGCGKSALAGRVVSLSNPAERASLLRALGGVPLGHADPGEKCVHAHVHARGLTTERLIEVLDDQLVARGLLKRHPAGSRNLGQLWGDLQARDLCPLLVIDGLDEAGLYAFRIAEDAVRLLSRVARVLVATRDLPAPEGQVSLVETLAPEQVLDLGDESLREATEADVRGYIALRLAGAVAVMDPAKVADVVVGAAREREEGVFLLARVVTSQLRDQLVDTSGMGWERLISRSIEAAFERDLRLVPPLRRGDAELPHAAMELLTALAWAYGAGFPDDVWPVVATALSPTGTAYDRADVFWLLGHAGRYIVEAGEGGRAAYRLSHQRLADHLRQTSQSAGEDTERQAAVVAVALVASYRALLDAGMPAEEPAYLRRYLWRHCADGGEQGITPLRELAQTHPIFLPDLAMALGNLGIRYAGVGRHHDALTHTEQAFHLYRTLAADNPAYLPDLAGALHNLGIHYAEVGRHHDALTHTEEAFHLYRALAADNPAHRPNLANALHSLGVRYAQVGRHHDALTHTEQAFHLYRALAADNPAHRPNLANALNSLGVHYAEVGRHHDALTPTKDAVSLYRTLAADNPAHQPKLANALNSLGVHYAEVGRHHDALTASEQAVNLYQGLAADNRAHLPNLAGALNSLGNHYAQVGRHHDALPSAEEAVRLYQGLAGDNPAHLPNLANALHNLGNRYAQVGRHHDALAASEEAVSIYRAQADDNPAHLPNLANALNSLGNRYAQVRRHHDALALTEDAVNLHREQVTNNPAHRPDLAMALTNLGIRYREVGRHHDALAPTEDAVSLYRTLAADNPAHRPNLANALHNLGNHYAQVRRHHDALTASEEAVSIYRAQAADNPAHLPNLANALNSLGNHYAEVGRAEEVGRVWRQTIDLLPSPAARAFLLIRRAEARPPRERVSAIRDLRRALRLVPEHKYRLVADCHATGRRLRALDPDAFDRVWPDALPPWLTLNQAHLDLTLEWTATDTVEAERDSFVTHAGELLGDATAVALDELGLALGDPTSVDHYRGLWDWARRYGVEEAYRLRLAGVLLARWMDADLDAKRSMLHERGDELLGTDVAEVLQAWREQDPDDDRPAIHKALLALAGAGHTAAAFAALADPDRFPPLLNQLARTGTDPAVIAAAATLAHLATDRPPLQAAALFHLALALTLDGQTEAATDALRAAHTADPAQSTDWLRLLFQLVPRHPQLQALSSALLDRYSGTTPPE